MSDQAPAGARGGLGLALLGGLLLAVLSQLGQRPPAPLPADAPPGVFSAARAFAALQAVMPEDAPHPVASPANAQVRDRILARLRELGLEPLVRRGFACDFSGKGCSRVENILARIPGREPGPALMLACHYDSRTSAPGAADDGAGVAAALEIARALKHEPPPREVLLLIDDGEEGGLIGARVFAESDPWKDQVGVVVNLEARGTAGPSMMFETSAGNAPEIAWYASVVSHPVASSLYFTIYRFLPNDTDMTIFKDAGMRGLNFAFIGNPADYHTPRDSLANLDRGSLQHHGQNALQLIRDLGGYRVPEGDPGNALYFDLYGRALVHFPAAWAPWLAGLALGLLLLGIHGRRRRGGAGVGRLLLGLLVLGGLLALGAGLLVAAHRGLASLGATPARWVTWPQPFLLSQALLAALLLGGLGGVLARQLGSAPARDVAWLGLGGLGLAAAIHTPGLSYLLWIPALVAGLTGLGGSPARDPLEVPPGAVLLPWLAFAALFLPHVLGLYEGLGLHLPGLQGVFVLLLLLPLLPWCGALGGRDLLGVALLAAAAAGGSLLVPPFSPEVPRPMVFRHLEDATTRWARWDVMADGPGLPAAVLAAAPFAETGEVFRGMKSRAATHSVTAAYLGLEPPEVLGNRRTPVVDELARWEFRLRSRRGARRLGISLPKGMRVWGLQFEDQVLRPGELVTLPRSREYLARVPAGQELKVLLTIPAADRPEIRVWDASDGLPEAAEKLATARPAHATPAHDGDRTRVSRALRPPG